MKTSFRTVPDTNVIIAAQNGSPTSPNREYFTRWKNEEFVLLFSDDTSHEYIEKLTERNTPEELIVELIVAIWKLGEHISIQFFHLANYPSDPDDIAFVLCAENGYATHLISYDKHLLDLQGFYSYKICKTMDFLSELRQALAGFSA
jgi:predicted nucleic acid-binding protein